MPEATRLYPQPADGDEPEVKKVYGPYITRCDPNRPRRFVIIMFADDSRKTTSYARFLMECHLGRRLRSDEHVDHIDEDCLNDSLDNLQVLDPIDNLHKSARPIEWVTIVCPVCLEPATKRAKDVRSNRKKGKAGPYCSKRCAGKVHH